MTMPNAPTAVSVEAIYELYLKWFEDETTAQFRRCEVKELRDLVEQRSPMSEPVFRSWWFENSDAAREAHLSDWKTGYENCFERMTARLRRWLDQN
jgi:hypothetical protein